MKPRAAAACACALLFALLGWSLLYAPVPPRGLTREAMAALPRSGVSNPVTAVLLNFRGYDTLLEIAVLLLAVVGIWSLREAEVEAFPAGERGLLPSLLRVALPCLVVVAGYLLWIGASAPGGAFQGGALLGGALVLALLSGRAAGLLRREAPLRLALILGLAVFMAVAAGVMPATDALLGYPAGTAGTWILVIEAAALISIGVTLGALFLGGRPAPGGPRPRETGAGRTH